MFEQRANEHEMKVETRRCLSSLDVGIKYRSVLNGWSHIDVHLELLGCTPSLCCATETRELFLQSSSIEKDLGPSCCELVSIEKDLGPSCCELVSIEKDSSS